MVVRRAAVGGRPAIGSLVFAAVVTVVAAAIVIRSVDRGLLVSALDRMADRPGPVVFALAGFALAFLLRSIAWRVVLPSLPFAQAWSGIHVALAANHLLPLRLGEPFRVLSAVRRSAVSTEAATASTIVLRSADVLTVVGLGILVSPSVFLDLVGPVGWVLVGLVALIAALSWRWLLRLGAGAGGGETRLPGPGVFALTAAAWLAESVVVWESARWVGLDIGWTEALLVSTVAVAAQIAAIAPGGFGTYEAASVAAYVALGFDADVALVAALGAHGLKTAYSLIVGGVAVIVPAPGLFGRFRLVSTPTVEAVTRWSSEADGDVVAPGATGAGGGGDRGRILLFMPAYNEEASVGPCVDRVPCEAAGLPVEVLVIDDGSTDATADRARSVGAEVLTLDRNRGLGAAVRVGLSEGVRRGAAAVVFCDADGEYPPEELDRMVEPVLAGRADYVTGSRFLGRIDHMRPHRRAGNLMLTAVLSIVARTRITDGQTGYRAFSPEAARRAEVIHDFNYAQVLTLDLLAKGFRMVEVPISYHFRTEGESYIKLGLYLRNVIPAVYRELNADLRPISRA